MTRNHVLSDSEPSPPNPTFLSNFLASGCPPTLPVSDVPADALLLCTTFLHNPTALTIFLPIDSTEPKTYPKIVGRHRPEGDLEHSLPVVFLIPLNYSTRSTTLLSS